MQRLREKIEIEPGDAAATGEDQDRTWSYGRRSRSNLELREKIEIEHGDVAATGEDQDRTGDAAATGKDEEEGYGKRQRHAEKMERIR
ncbi:hypothetical protein ACFX19_041851 [Malus domestica]